MTTTDPAQWIVTETPIQAMSPGASNRTALSVAHVTLPDGVQFEQIVLRVRPAAMCVLVDDRQRALMLRRHRFILNAWLWEIPGGYLEHDEDPAACAARECEEETGWRPGRVEHLATFEPMTGNAAAPNHVYLGLDPMQVTDVLDANETQQLQWVPLIDAPGLIATSTLGAACVVGMLAARERLGIK